MEEEILWKIRGLLSPSFDSFFAFATHLGAWQLLYPAAALAGERLPRFRALFYAGAAALAALVGLSRLVLGVHWPRDVLGGLVLGALQAALAARIMSSLSRKASS